MALWLRCRSFEAEAALLEKDDFAQEINGKVLLRLCESDLRSLGDSRMKARARAHTHAHDRVRWVRLRRNCHGRLVRREDSFAGKIGSQGGLVSLCLSLSLSFLSLSLSLSPPPLSLSGRISLSLSLCLSLSLSLRED